MRSAKIALDVFLLSVTAILLLALFSPGTIEVPVPSTTNPDAHDEAPPIDPMFG